MDKTLWDRITEAFGTKQVSDISKRLEMSEATLYKWKRGVSLPEGSTLVKIRQETGYSSQWILTGEGPKLVKVEDSTEKLGRDPRLDAIDDFLRDRIKAILSEELPDAVDRQLKRTIMEIQFESLVPTDVPITRIPVPIIDAVAGGAADEPFRIKPRGDDSGSSDRRSERRKTG